MVIEIILDSFQKDCDVFIANMPKETFFFFFKVCFVLWQICRSTINSPLVSLGLRMCLHISAFIISNHFANTCILPHKIPAN